MESLFFKYFFFTFLIGIFISALIIVLLIGIFTNNYYDKTFIYDIIKLEKKYAEEKIKSANIKVNSLLLKYQVNINELIFIYQKIANYVIDDDNLFFLEGRNLISAVDVEDSHCSSSKYANTHAVWVYDEFSTNSNIGAFNQVAEQQLIAFDHFIENLDAIYQISRPETYSYFFYFEETELYITYPLSSECESKNVYNLNNYDYLNLNRCIDENSEFCTTYKVKCEYFFQNMMKSKTGVFDNNYKSNQNRTIF